MSNKLSLLTNLIQNCHDKETKYHKSNTTHSVSSKRPDVILRKKWQTDLITKIARSEILVILLQRSKRHLKQLEAKNKSENSQY